MCDRLQDPLAAAHDHQNGGGLLAVGLCACSMPALNGALRLLLSDQPFGQFQSRTSARSSVPEMNFMADKIVSMEDRCASTLMVSIATPNG